VARPFHLDAPDRLQIREGGGCLSVFGLPFFGAGVFMMLTVAGVIPISNASEMSRWGWLALAGMGLVFTGVGGTLVFGRAWTTLDVTQRLVIRQWGPLIPLHERTHPLTGYSAVTLGFVRGDSDTADRFPVGLKAPSGINLSLCSFTTYATSRACAIAVARHLHVDIEDSTTDHRVDVTPADAERSLREKAGAFIQEVAAPQPVETRSTVTQEPDGVRIDIPFPTMHPAGALAGLIPLAIPVLGVPWLLDFFRQTRTPDVFGWVFIGFLIVGFGVLPAMTVVSAFRRSRRGGTIVRVSPRRLQIQERGAWRTRSVASIEAADILDVDYSTHESAAAWARLTAEQQAMGSTGSASAAVGPRTGRLLMWLTRLAKSRGLTVKTRTGLTSFGEGLGDEEVRYLHVVIVRTLQGRS
jgi:hypothetical protein